MQICAGLFCNYFTSCPVMVYVLSLVAKTIVKQGGHSSSGSHGKPSAWNVPFTSIHGLVKVRTDGIHQLPASLVYQ